MNPRNYEPATQPSLYFIGVTTGKSSIMQVFPQWARHLNLRDAAIKGIDFVPHDRPEYYREAVAFIKSDPLSQGALVTTHKLDLLKACRDQFDALDEYAALMSEVSSISKHNGQLVGHAKDPITAGLALEAFLPHDHWLQTGAEALVLGAGGSAVAITWYLMKPEHQANRPTRIIVANRSTPRLEEMRALHQQLATGVPVDYVHAPQPEITDGLMKALKPGSLVINATGLGKDAPGSPITDAACFPQDAWVWEFNYRGNLRFLDQARAQERARNLRIEDGWIYFIHGWTRVVAEVFHIDIPTSGPRFDELSRIAAAART